MKKNRVTFTTGKTRLVDCKEYEKKITEVEKDIAVCILRGDYVKVAKLRTKRDELVKEFKFMQEKQVVTLADLIQNLSEKDKLNFSATCCSIIALSDLIDSASTDLQSVMTKMGAPAHLNIMHAVKAIKKNAQALVCLFGKISDTDEQERFAEFGNSLYNTVKLRSLEFAKGEKRRNNLKVDKRFNEDKEKSHER